MADTPVDYRARIQPDGDNLQESGNNASVLNAFDTGKLVSVLRRSIIWIFLISVVSLSGAYVFLRYTKPLYQSVSDIKLDFKSEASLFGFSNFNDNPNLGYLSGEIELLRSRLFFSQVIKALPLEVSYYNQGTILNEERYRDAPIEAFFTIRDESILDRRILLTIVDGERFRITFPGQDSENAKEYRFGDAISTNSLELRIENSERLNPNYYGEDVYFIINSERALINYIERNLEVRPLNVNANTIRISFQDHNQLKATELVRAITSIYQSYTQSQKQQANQQKIDFLNHQLDQTEERLDEYERYFENFTIQNKTTNLDSDLQTVIQQIVQLDTLLAAARSRKRNLDQLYQDIVDSADAPSSSYAFPELNEALSRLQELNLEAQRRRISYDPRTLAVRRIEQEVTLARKELLDELSQLRKVVAEEVITLDTQRNKLQSSFVKLPAKGTEFNQAQRFYKLFEEFYLTLMQRKAEFEIAQAGTTTEFVILTPATYPSVPISPNKLLVWGIGFFGGFGISLLLVVGRYLLHNTISSLSELEQLTQTPVLGGIPAYREEKLPVTRMVISRNPKSSISEAFRSIRTNMEFLTSNGGIHTISVTSTISGEGKTFVSTNLGGIISLSKQRVVIVDLDMRRPRVHLAFGDENGHKGTSTILIQKHSVDECLQKTEFENLHYIPVGPTPPNPSELLLGDSFDRLIEELKEKFDVVVFDTPPIGLVTDGVLVMKKVDLPIYVFRADYSKRLFARTLKRMRTVNKFSHLSLVLNAIKNNAGQGYGYGYGYTYGYYQEDASRKQGFFKRIFRK